MSDAGGNNERLVFIFDGRKLARLDETGEIALPPSRTVWIDEFDKAWEEGTMFLLTMHPHISGHRSRIVALELLLAHIQARGKVWFATHRAAAEYVKQQAGM